MDGVDIIVPFDNKPPETCRNTLLPNILTGI
jgi:hypothetical protein